MSEVGRLPKGNLFLIPNLDEVQTLGNLLAARQKRKTEIEAAAESGQTGATSGELPPGLEDIELPEEQAQALAEYMAQMLMSGELGDPMIWSPERVGVPGGEPKVIQALCND